MDIKSYNLSNEPLDMRCRRMCTNIFGQTRFELMYETFIWTLSNLVSVTGTGAIANSGSAIDLTTGANAVSTATIRPSQLSATNKTPYIGTTKPFLMAFRMKMDTTPDAETEAWMGTFSGQAKIGVVGSISATNFSALFDSGAAPSLTSAVAVDTTNWHEILCWKDGTGTTYLSVDNEKPVSSATAAPSASSALAFFVGNNATAGEQSMKVEQAVFAFGVEGS